MVRTQIQLTEEQVEALKAHAAARSISMAEAIRQAVDHWSLSALLVAGRRRLSLVDCASFDGMRRLGLNTAFTLDPHFGDQGFTCLPAL